MWYVGTDGTVIRFGFATSTDGLNWTRHAANPILEAGISGEWDTEGINSPEVLYRDSTYHMWYSGFSQNAFRIGYATSANGVEFTKHNLSPVLNTGASGMWDDVTVVGPSIIFADSIYHMWYGGFGGDKFRVGYATSSITVNVFDRQSVIPSGYTLEQNYPNPFNPRTKILFDLPKSGEVTLKIYNALGMEVATLVDKNLPPGRYTVKWNAAGFASGVYHYRLDAGGYSETKRLVLLK